MTIWILLIRQTLRVKQYAAKISAELAMETDGKFIVDIIAELEPVHLFIPNPSGEGSVVFNPGVMMQQLKNLKLLLFDRFQRQEDIPAVRNQLCLYKINYRVYLFG